MKEVYEATEKLCNNKSRHIDMIKNKNGNLLIKDNEIGKRWGEHFDELLNGPAPSSEADTDEETKSIKCIKTGCFTRTEIRNVMHKMKNREAARIDSITI